uniref:Cytochrome P450 CYP12A2-like n=2 Tax=Stomoxys calcitrans TaxID=35570 RepID=A0A1I8PMH2_STOCA
MWIQQQLCHNPSTVTDSATEASPSSWDQAKSFKNIPSMGPLKLLLQFFPGGKYANLDTSQLVLAIKRDMGPICRLSGLFGKPGMIMTHNPNDFKTILRNEGIWPERPNLEGLHYYRTVHRKDFLEGVEGLLASQGENWGTFRSTVNPIIMQPKNSKLYIQRMSAVNKEFMERIREIRSPVNEEVPHTFEQEINHWTLETICLVILDKKLNLINGQGVNPMADQLLKSLNDAISYSLDVERKPSLWVYYKTPTFNKLMKTFDTVTDIVMGYVEEVVKRLEEDRQKNIPEKSEDDKSIIEKLIKTDKKIAVIMTMDMLLAGLDTTTSMFTGLLLCLAKNPEKQQLLRQEVMQLLPQKDSEFDEKLFKNMPYLRACIKESLRLYPVSNGSTRHPNENVILSGYRVPKGVQVNMVFSSLLKDDSLYARAQEYLPERWLRSAKKDEELQKECPLHAFKGRSSFVYLPFGFGTRSCIGRRIAEMSVEMAVARLIRKFYVEFHYSTENAFKSLLFNVPNIPLKFQFSDVEK